MVTFRHVRERTRVTGFHAHHLIPKQIADYRYFAPFFVPLLSAGLNLDNFVENGMLLPHTESLGELFELPVHRGPHPQYTAMVSHHIASLMHLSTHDALHAIAALQCSLRAGLRRAGSGHINIVRSPMFNDVHADMDAIGLMGDRRARIIRIR